MTQEGFSAHRRDDGSIDTDFYSGRAYLLRNAEFRAYMAGFRHHLIWVWGIALQRSLRQKRVLRHAPR